jgi:pyruvate dehydrogenase E2 component (dihydrolipoamide acetyltransferase)
MATAVIMPRQGQSVESCILVEWLARAGDAVREGQPLANIETDKAVFEVESPAAGTLLEVFFDAGADVPVLTNIAAIGAPGEDVSALRPDGAATGAPATTATATSAAATAAAPEPAATTTAASTGAGVSPRARKLAADKGVDARALAGSGPEGRVIARDVEAAAAGLPRVSPAARAEASASHAAVPAAGSGPGGMVTTKDLVRATAAAPSPTPAATAPAATEATVELPLSGIRRIIADRMRKSLAGTAQLTLSRVFDATAILEYRAKIKAGGESMGLPNITINDMIAFATVRTLSQFPELNAHFLGDRILRFPRVNLGVAMETPRGLMVPVVREADRLSLTGMSRAVKPLADAARQGNINPDTLTGGTFTITNMGMLGIETFTPILNAPEVAILGIGGTQLRPVMRGGAVAHVQCIALSLTVDHQAVDGAPGARFLQALSEALERFELLLSA